MKISHSSCQLKIVESANDAHIKDLQESFCIVNKKIEANRQTVSQSTIAEFTIDVLQEKLNMAYKKRDAILKELQVSTLSYHDVLAQIIQGHNGRSIIQSNFDQA